MNELSCGALWDFPIIWVPYFGVLIIRYYIRVPYFRKHPYGKDLADKSWGSALNYRVLLV